MKIAIFGASALAREVADVAAASGTQTLVFIDQHASEKEITDIPVEPESSVARLASAGFHFAIGIGDNSIRKKIAEKFAEVAWCSLVHPNASFGRDQRERLNRSRGTVVMAATSFTNNITVGNFCIFNPGVTIAHDCIIEDFVYVAPGAHVSGNVHLHEGCYIGTGASFIHGRGERDKLQIGAWSTVGVGAAVIRDVSEGVTVAGVPAKPLSK